MSERRNAMGRALLLGALALALPLTAGHAQSWRTLTSSRQLWDTRPLRVEVEYAAGDLELTQAPARTLYRLEMRYDERHFLPVTEYDEQTRTLRLGVDGRDERRGGPGGREGSRATIALSREVPLDLELEFGAGEARIDLGGLRLQSVELSTGASDTEVRFDEPNPVRARHVKINAGAAELRVIGLGNARAERIDFQGGVGSTVLDFTGEWSGNGTASVKMGVGSVVLRLPRDLGVRIDRSSFLTSFEAEGMTRRDGSYFSSNWSGATRRLTIDVEAAIGSIEVDWVD